jgi:PPOX class probable F420-dependent enzyme
MAKLSRQAKKLIDGRNFANVATVMPDGSPQVAPVWADREGDLVVINTTIVRQKYRNLRKDPRVALCIFDMVDPYLRTIVRGRVVEFEQKGAEDHIDKLSMKYDGTKYPKHDPGEPRVILKIRPDHVTDQSG